MFGSNFRDFVSQDATSQGQSNSERLIKSWHGFERSDSEDSGIEEGFEVLDSESQEIPATPCSTPPEDLSLENAILANFPDGCDRSFTVELKDEDSYGIIPKNLTFAEIINILNQAVREDDCEELDEVVQNIEDYEGRSIMLDNENLKDFCSNQLNLELQNRSNHQHIYSNVLSQYKFDQEGFKYDYSVKELVLLAIAANDKLTERYQDILFAEGNLSLLPLLVGGQKYIEAFIEKFHGTDGVYGRLKDQAIQLVEPNKIDFFSVIALRKEQELLNAVFVEYVLRDLEQVLKTSKPDPLYGVLETASLIKNEEFITIVLGAFERYINEPTKKASIEELLKKSFATLLETAISQERISVIEYLCKRYTNSADRAIYDVYEQAFADDKVITILRQQILKNIGARGRREIYDLILKTALDAGNIAFIEHLCKECAECSNDVIGYLNQKSKNNEFDNIHESILIALSNVEYTNTNVIVEVLFYTKEIHQNVSHNEQVIRQVIQNILKNATHYSIGQEDYSLVKGVCYLCTEIDAINIIFREECGIFKSSIEKRIEDLEKENKLLQSEALREYNYSYLPGIVNGLAQTAYIAYDEYTKDPKDNKRQENTDLILSLMQIRNILQFSIDVQEYPCHERQDLWDEMCQTPGTFIIRKRSNNVADELEIPVITSDILSENPAPKNQQPQENVDRRENIMNNRGGSTEELISNSFEEGEMHSSDQNTKSIEEALSDAIFDLNYKKVESLVEQVKQEGNNVERIINWALEKANETRVGKKDKESKDKIKKIREFLAEELIAASPVDASVESIGATASGQEIPMVEFEESEPNSPSLSSEDDDYSKLEGDQNDKFSGISSGSGSPFEEVVVTSEMPSMATEEAKVNDEQSDNINGDDLTPVLSFVSEDVLTSRSDEEEPNLASSNDKSIAPKVKTPVSTYRHGIPCTGSSFYKAGSSQRGTGLLGNNNGNFGAQLNRSNIFSAKEHSDSPPLSPQSSVSGDECSSGPSSFTKLPKSDEGDTDNNNDKYVKVSSEDITKEDLTPKGSGSLQGIQPEISVPSPSAFSNVNGVPTIEGHMVIMADIEDSKVSSIVSEDSLIEDVTDELDKTNKGDSTLKSSNSTKSSKLPVIAASALAIAGIISGVAVAVYLEMLAVGIAVGACCLVAAVIIYCCNRPSSSFKGSNVEPVANGKLVE